MKSISLAIALLLAPICFGCAAASALRHTGRAARGATKAMKVPTRTLKKTPTVHDNAARVAREESRGATYTESGTGYRTLRHLNDGTNIAGGATGDSDSRERNRGAVPRTGNSTINVLPIRNNSIPAHLRDKTFYPEKSTNGVTVYSRKPPRPSGTTEPIRSGYRPSTPGRSVNSIINQPRP